MSQAPTTISSNSIPSRAKYTCVCQEGFYLPNATLQGFSSDLVESSAANLSCIACPNECKFCDSDGSCSTGHVGEEDMLTESIIKICIGSTLGVCFGSCLILAYLVYRRRKQTVSLQSNSLVLELKMIWFFYFSSQIIGMWTILETILLGMIFLYAAVSVASSSRDYQL